MKEENFHVNVANYWQNLHTIHVLPKLIFVSKYMATRGITFFHKFRDKVIKQKEVIEQFKDREDDDGIQLYFDGNEKLNDLLLTEELYRKQRAKTFWLEAGETNYQFLHASASSSKKSNLISVLETDDGMGVSDHDQFCRLL